MTRSVGLYAWCLSWWLYDHKLPGSGALHRFHRVLWRNEAWTRAEVAHGLTRLGYHPARADRLAWMASRLARRVEPAP